MNPRPGMDLRRAGVLTCLLITATARSAPPTGTQPATNDVARLVQDYFLQDDSAERRELCVRIEGIDGVIVAQVAEAVRQVQVWEPRPAGRGDFAFVTALGEKRAVQVRIPEGYDPAKRYPVIVGLDGAGEDEGGRLDGLLALIGPGRDEFVIAAPVRYDGALFDVKPTEALEPVDLLHELRRRYRVDSDRVYVIGTAKGGSAALNLGVFYTHWLAGVVVLNDTLCVPYPKQSYEFLLPNLTNTPTLLVWFSDNRGGGTTQPVRAGSVAGSNEIIRELSERMRLPIESIELRSGGEAPGLTQILDRVTDILQSRRDPDPRMISHWFRYPVQGRSGWLRQLVFDGRPWETSHITIVSSASTDFHAYATKILQGKLAHIGGRIEEQRININTVNTTEVELRLCEHLVDLEQPIQIDWNGRKRFSAKVEPRISTLLELAYEDWDFQHPVPVRLVIGETGPPRQR